MFAKFKRTLAYIAKAYVCPKNILKHGYLEKWKEFGDDQIVTFRRGPRKLAMV
jgi:hypothetical protein